MSLPKLRRKSKPDVVSWFGQTPFTCTRPTACVLCNGVMKAGQRGMSSGPDTYAHSDCAIVHQIRKDTK